MRPPTPLVPAFVVCRKMFESPPPNDEFCLVSPMSHIDEDEFPASATVAIYAHITDAQGEYLMELRLVNEDGETVWNWKIPKPAVVPNRLLPLRLGYYNVVLEAPRPGRYDLLLLANGEEVGRNALWFGTLMQLRDHLP